MEDWILKSLADRYLATHGITLSNDQAKLVFEFEQLLSLNSQQFHFTIWEQLDFCLTTFQKFLSPEQYELFRAGELNSIQIQEQELISRDLSYEQQIKSAKELIDYYERVLMPSLRNNLLVPIFFNGDLEEIKYLRAEFRKYIESEKKALLVRHFRSNRTFMPKLLELSLLLHEQSVLVPDYPAFRRNMKAPAIAVADYLEEKLRRGSTNFNGYSLFSFEALIKPLKDLEQFQARSVAKHVDEISGWHVESVKGEYNFMFLLLLDHGKQDK